MISRFNRLLVILVLIFVSLYLVIMNRESATFSLGGEWSVTANLGVLLISAFSAGLLFSSLIALFFGFKAWIRERSLLARDRQRKSFLDGLVEARGLLAAHQWERSQTLWQGLSRADPTECIARIELSRSLEQQGELSEALKVIEAIRAENTDNLEVLFRAFEINKGLGNNTAAIDNLALVLAKHPTLRAAVEARDLSEQLGKIGDALEYHEQCVELGEEREHALVRGAELQLKLLLSDRGKEPELLRKELHGFLKRFPDIIAGHRALATLEIAGGNNTEGAQALINAAKSGAGLSAWNDAAKLWLTAGKPEKALAAARSAAQGTTGIKRVEAALFLIQIHLGLSQAEEAEKELEKLKNVVVEQSVQLSRELTGQLESLSALAAYRLGKTSLLVENLAMLSGIERHQAAQLTERKNGGAVTEPSPVYSTP